jgi:glycosyltransferase involved in cell wall biosynthesis
VKILFDTQIFDWQINGGISRYFVEVLQRLQAQPETEVLFRVSHSYNTYIQSTPWLVNKPMLKGVNFKGKLRLLKKMNEKINRRYSNKMLRQNTADIFHPTYYDPYFLPLLGKRPFVLTVYDLTHEKFFADNPSTRQTLAWKKQLIEAADHIVAISENTRKDVIEYYKVSPQKVTTVYLSGGFDDPGQLKKTADAPSISSPYILFVGSRTGYKNFQAFVREAAPVLVKENISLVIAGGGNLNADESALLNKLGLANRFIALSHVSDTVLQQLYRDAMVFIFPSLYEGFGIPVLEAMQCNCPALLSNNSSLPEVGGNAATYFDPFTEGDMQLKLDTLVKDSEARTRMVKEGREQLKKFNWDATAHGHIGVYKNLLT